MITEAMVMKGLAYIGAWTIGLKVVVPAAEVVGTHIGHGAAVVVNKLKGKKNKSNQGKVGDDQVTEQKLLALLQECNEAYSENDTKEEPDNTEVIVEEVKPEPMFDQRTLDWIQKCRDQYGGFANVILE